MNTRVFAIMIFSFALTAAAHAQAISLGWQQGLGGAAIPVSLYPNATTIYAKSRTGNPITPNQSGNWVQNGGMVYDYEMADAPVVEGVRLATVTYTFPEPVAINEFVVISGFPADRPVKYKYEAQIYDPATMKFAYRTLDSGNAVNLQTLKSVHLPGGEIVRRIRLSCEVADEAGDKGRFSLGAVYGMLFWNVDSDGDGCCLLCDPMPGNAEVDCHNGWPSTGGENTSPCQCLCCDHGDKPAVKMEPEVRESGIVFMLRGETRGNVSGHSGVYARSKAEAVSAILNGGESFERVQLSLREQYLMNTSHPQGIALSGGQYFYVENIPANQYHSIVEYRIVYPMTLPETTEGGEDETSDPEAPSRYTGKAYLGINAYWQRNGMGAVKKSPRIVIRAGQIDDTNRAASLSPGLKAQFLQTRTGAILWSGTIVDLQRHPYENNYYHLPLHADRLNGLRSVVVHFEDVTTGYGAQDWVTAPMGAKVRFVFGRDFGEEEGLEPGGEDREGAVVTGDEDDEDGYIRPGEDPEIPEEPGDDEEPEDPEDPEDPDDPDNPNGPGSDSDFENPWDWIVKHNWNDADLKFSYTLPFSVIPGLKLDDVQGEIAVVETLSTIPHFETWRILFITILHFLISVYLFHSLAHHIYDPLGK